VLTSEEARELLDSIPIARNTGPRRGQAESEEPSLVGLRDRALIGVMVYKPQGRSTLVRRGAMLFHFQTSFSPPGLLI
jgi:hypothetical protein